MLDLVATPGVVALARKSLEDAGRVSSEPVRFRLTGMYGDEGRIDVELTGDAPCPPWGWPVLDTRASVDHLGRALATIRTKCLKRLVLVMEQVKHAPITIFDFLHDTPVDIAPPNVRPITVPDLEEVAARISDVDLQPDQCVIITALDDAFSLSEDLSKHMMYAMDGTKDILWSGTVCEGDSVDAISKAVNLECASTGRRRSVLAVLGTIVDMGSGRALIKSPHRVALLETA
ncbi:hypothetical protein [uncultured Flavonifractor sp.]|uniref:hypothetical protein n=1 Tax=uncultured Flavonifractor sp. TaxID=1193534 RepID=UPI002598532F|nr:hypothetical protein [uncultured Flavonifractor sp.]